MIDEAELRAQLEQHHAMSYGWALSCCARSPDLADDVLQTAYLKILQGRARFNGRATFKTWLFAVIRITAVDEKRRQWLRLFQLSRQERDVGVHVPMKEDHFDQSERLEAFQRALSRLPKQQQEVMHLIFYQDLSLQDASEVMGVSLGSARVHYERGKRKLRAWLEKLELFDEYGKNRAKAERTL